MAATASVVGALPADASSPTPPDDSVDPATAWKMLTEGNARFVTGEQRHPHEQLEWREKLVDEQHPFACVLGCADSRVSPELVFDHGLGDLFTVRSAGEVLDDSVLGSVEYAVEHLGVRLVVVLGHESCGAVSAARDFVRGKGEFAGGVSTLVRSIEATVLATPPEADEAKFLAACVDNQARRVVDQLKERSVVLREAAAKHDVEIVPASYNLHTFAVARLD
ncbi:carbonic anhydrase [Amycolatopsis antarctica]|uniref:Carbonic anhydrase n=2 Tax=Amycolatopsis antarctica TaxID=1854586 RepID=A0A263D3R0_9PSEU|nr:carbonic anhydrase [Amycolatopsis antarctica]